MATIAELKTKLTIPEGQTESDIPDYRIFIKDLQDIVYVRINAKTVALLKTDGKEITVEDFLGLTDYQIPVAEDESYLVQDYLTSETKIKDLNKIKDGEIRIVFPYHTSFNVIDVKNPENINNPKEIYWQRLFFVSGKSVDTNSVFGFWPKSPIFLLNIRQIIYDANTLNKYEDVDIAELMLEQVFASNIQAGVKHYRYFLYFALETFGPSKSRLSFDIPKFGSAGSKFGVTYSGSIKHAPMTIPYDSMFPNGGVFFNGISTCLSAPPLLPATMDFSLTFVFKIINLPLSGYTPDGFDSRVDELSDVANLFTQFIYSSEESGYGRLGLSVYRQNEWGGGGNKVKLFIGNDANNKSLHLVNDFGLNSNINIVSLYRTGASIYLSVNRKVVHASCQHSILQSGCLIGAVGKNPAQFDDQLDEFFPGIIAGIYFHPTSSDYVDIIERYANKLHNAGIVMS